jgi:hypothetical protein
LARETLRIAETEKANAQLAERLEQLRAILSHALGRDPSINFDNFLKYPEESELDSDETLRLFPKPNRESFLPKKPPFIARLIPESKTAIEPTSSLLNSVFRRNSKHLKKFTAVAAMLWPFCMHLRRSIIGLSKQLKWPSQIMIRKQSGVISS